MSNNSSRTSYGFTIVELLIVIVVIAILATISIVAYNGIQARARDSQRQEDVKTIVKALELYYIDNGKYPLSNCVSGCTINGSWSNTNDGSWQNLAALLVPKYLSSLPSDPNPSMGTTPLSVGRYGYAYYSNQSSYCGTQLGQMYILVYTLETTAQQDTLNGTCTTSPLYYANKSNYRLALNGS
jgi:prepilin-type N-terminal cleavage/methylation domain-containing protein